MNPFSRARANLALLDPLDSLGLSVTLAGLYERGSCMGKGLGRRWALIHTSQGHQRHLLITGTYLNVIKSNPPGR